MTKSREAANVFYVPLIPRLSFPSEADMAVVKEQVREGIVHAVVLETRITGAVPTEPCDVLSAISELSQQVPTFLLVQAPSPQRYPRMVGKPEAAGGVVLQNACSAMADEVVTQIRNVLRQTGDKNEAIEAVKELFRQTT